MTDFEKIHSFESLYNAYRKARQGKRWKGAAAKFEVNLLEALNLLSAQIRTKRYTMSPYNTFEVYEPKRRRSKNNMKRKLKKLAALHAAGRIDAKTVEQSYQSWRGHAEKGNSYHLIRRTDQFYDSLMKTKEAAQCQKH